MKKLIVLMIGLMLLVSVNATAVSQAQIDEGRATITKFRSQGVIGSMYRNNDGWLLVEISPYAWKTWSKGYKWSLCIAISVLNDTATVQIVNKISPDRTLGFYIPETNQFADATR